MNGCVDIRQRTAGANGSSLVACGLRLPFTAKGVLEPLSSGWRMRGVSIRTTGSAR